MPFEVKTVLFFKNACCHLSFRDWMWDYHGLLRANLSTLFMLGCTLFSVAAFVRQSGYPYFVNGM
jgi:hypothetical protein